MSLNGQTWKPIPTNNMDKLLVGDGLHLTPHITHILYYKSHHVTIKNERPLGLFLIFLSSTLLPRYTIDVK